MNKGLIRIFVLALGTFALGTDVFVIAGILPAVAKDLDVSISVAGQQVTIFAITYALGSPILATLVGNISQRKVLLISLFGFGLANILCAIAPNYWFLLMARVLTAIFAALYTPNAYAAAASIAPPEERGKALSMVLAGLTLSTVFGVPLGIWVGQAFGWQFTFVVVASLGLLAFLGLTVLLPQIPSPPKLALKDRLKMMKNSRLLVALSLTTIVVAGAFTVYTYIVPLLRSTAHLSETKIAPVLLVYGIAAVLGNWLGGIGADRWSPTKMIASNLILQVVALITLIFMETVISVSIVVFLWGIAWWAFVPAQQSRLIGMADKMPGVIMAFNGSAIYLGIALGGAIGGFILHNYSETSLAWTGSSMELIALLVLGTQIFKRKSKSGASMTKE